MPRPIPVEEMVKQFKGHHQNSHLMKIENFSSFKKHQIDEIESLVFDIGSKKWTLTINPNGTESSKGYIALYLEIQNSESFQSNWQFKLHFQLFILNQFRQTWYSEEENVILDASQTSWGFGRFISLDEFADSKNGYLVEDCALIGVKILGLKDTKGGTAESFTLIDKFQSNKFAWKLVRFSALDQLTYNSDEFIIGNRKWRIRVYPRGSSKIPDMLQIYLKAEGFVNNAPKAHTYARYTLRVSDQINSKHVTKTNLNEFPADPYSYGSNRLMPLKDIRSPWNCYLVNDTLYVEIEVHVISQSKHL